MIEYAAWLNVIGNNKDSHFCFRNVFQVDTVPQSAFLEISADSTFSVWINGRRCPISQFSDFPRTRTFSKLEIASYLQSGLNCVAVEVHYLGESFSTYITGTPYLKAVIHTVGNILTATGPGWKIISDPAFRSGLECKITSQLSYAFQYDARLAADWRSVSFDDSAWVNAEAYPDGSNWDEMKERPVKQLKELSSPAVALVQHGLLYRIEEKTTFALSCQSDLLRPLRHDEAFSQFPKFKQLEAYSRTRVSLLPDGSTGVTFKALPDNEPVNGYYLIADLGRETVGWLELDITAPAGTVIDIAHGEHLDDGRCRAAIGNRNFADRYICREGRNQFRYYHRRLGARYIELHITNITGEVKVHYAGLLPLELPLPESAVFHCEDDLLNRINEVASDTLKLCMHEHYEDCPWREQALYAFDSRNQMMYGYYLWGNYKFAAASLDLLAQSYRGDGYLCLTAPGAFGKTIPSFTLVWISALREQWLYSGSDQLFRRHAGLIDEIIDYALERRDQASGLYHSAPENTWNFFEWRGQLDKVDSAPNSLYNIFLYEALTSAALMQHWAANPVRAEKLEQVATELGKNIEQTFYDSASGCYSLYPNHPGDDLYELVQAVMLYNRLVPADKIDQVVDAIAGQKLISLTYSSLFYLVNGLMQANATGRDYLNAFLRKQFALPLLNRATSLWETPYAGDDFYFAGSLCHAWSSVTPYYSGSCLLGITPLEPGFKTFMLKIHPGHLTHASGSVPTPYGDIRVSWVLNAEQRLEVSVEYPSEITMNYSDFPKYPVHDLIPSIR